MNENTTETNQSRTGRQTPSWSNLGMFGGTGIVGPVKLTDTGTTILPVVASTRGSGALEGRNPYDYVAPYNTPGYGAWSGLFGINGTYQRWPGDYVTYRAMIRYPVIALTCAAVWSPILAGKWSIECEDDAPKEAEELIADAILPMRIQLLRPMLRAMNFGFAPLELVWGQSDDGWKVPKVRELLPELTQIDVDEHGEVVAIRNTGAILTKGQFALYAYEREADNWYGMPRLENLRRTWANLLAAEDKLARLEGKASGILPRIYYPPDFKAPADPKDSNYSKAMGALMALMNGNGIAMQYSLPPIDSLERQPDLAKHRLIDVDLLDMDNCGPSQTALMARIDALQRDCVRGYLRSERTVIEAQTAGSRADAEAHTASISDTDTDRVHADIVDAINDQVIAAVLEENFGPKYRDAVRLVPREVVDENRIIDAKVLDAMLQNPSALPEILQRLDLDSFCQRNNIKLREDAEPWDAMALPTAMDQMQAKARAGPFSDTTIEGEGKGNAA